MNEVFMKRIFSIVLVLSLLSAPLLFAQEQETPLGDIARALRKSKKAAEQTVVDNDNLSKVVEEAESRRVKGTVKFNFEG